IPLPALRVDRSDLHAQACVDLPAPGRRPPLPRVEPRPRDLQRAAQQPDWKRGLLRGDERKPHGFSFAKKAVAFFRMSRSIRNVRTSRRRRANSSRSSVVSAPGRPRPASTSACRTHSRSAVSVRSSSRAIAPTDFPLSRTSRTVSALNSFVNARRLRLAMTHSYRTFVRLGVSTKPGQAQAPQELGDRALELTRADASVLLFAAHCPQALQHAEETIVESAGDVRRGQRALAPLIIE